MHRTRIVSISPRLVAAIRERAQSTARSESACVERAWAAARVRFASLPPPAPLAQGFEIVPIIPDVEYTDPRAEQIYAEQFASDEVAALALTLQLDVLEDMIDESFRLARSLGWLVERAWCLSLETGSHEWWLVSSEAVASGDTMPMARLE